mmetsp:Transcript_137/g.503  ORF Transcript_137/g.503 Transcript_137/m.503 type:complete len:221 (+) Transcript_137:786-1448(+)
MKSASELPSKISSPKSSATDSAMCTAAPLVMAPLSPFTLCMPSQRNQISRWSASHGTYATRLRATHAMFRRSDPCDSSAKERFALPHSTWALTPKHLIGACSTKSTSACRAACASDAAFLTRRIATLSSSSFAARAASMPLKLPCSVPCQALVSSGGVIMSSSFSGSAMPAIVAASTARSNAMSAVVRRARGLPRPFTITLLPSAQRQLSQGTAVGRPWL